MWAGEGPGLMSSRRPIAWEVLGLPQPHQAWIATEGHCWQILRAHDGVYGNWSGKYKSLEEALAVVAATLN